MYVCFLSLALLFLFLDQKCFFFPRRREPSTGKLLAARRSNVEFCRLAARPSELQLFGRTEIRCLRGNDGGWDGICPFGELFLPGRWSGLFNFFCCCYPALNVFVCANVQMHRPSWSGVNKWWFFLLNCNAWPEVCLKRIWNYCCWVTLTEWLTVFAIQYISLNLYFIIVYLHFEIYLKAEPHTVFNIIEGKGGLIIQHLLVSISIGYPRLLKKTHLPGTFHRRQAIWWVTIYIVLLVVL